MKKEIVRYFKFLKPLLLALIVVLVSFTSLAQVNSNHVKVKGHYRNGTYIKEHYRTAPNSTNRDNFSTVGNTNPYTGRTGYIPRDTKPYNSTGSYYNSNTPSYNSIKTYEKPTISEPKKNIVRHCKASNCTNLTRFQNISSNYCSGHTPECAKSNCRNLVEEEFGGFSILCNTHSK